MIRRPITILLALLLLAGLLASCGGGSDDTSSTKADTTPSKQDVITPAKAFQSGKDQCKLLGVRGLQGEYHTSNLEVLAKKYSQDIYIDGYPKSAEKGCLVSLQASAVG